MRFNTATFLASTLAIASAAPTNSKPSTSTGNTNIDYCASRGGLVNALNCVKLLNNLHLDLDILKKREPEPLLGLGGSGSKKGSGPSETTINYCSSQGILNLANCLDILNDVEVDVEALDLGDLSDLGVKEKRNWDDKKEWEDDDTPAPVTTTTTTTTTKSPEKTHNEWEDDDIPTPVITTTKAPEETTKAPEPTKTPEKPPQKWTDYGLSDKDIKVCKSKGLVNALNCLSILNNLNLSIRVLDDLL